MPRYRVTEKSYINGRVVNEGEVIEYDGIPHNNLEPMDKTAEKKAEEAEGNDANDKARLMLAAMGGNPDDAGAPGDAPLV